MGDVVLLELLKERGLLPNFNAAVDVFCLVEDETVRADSLDLVQRLREAGCAVEYSFLPTKSDKQFKRALECNAGFTVRLEKTADGSSVRVKNLKERKEEVLGLSAAVEFFSRTLGDAGGKRSVRGEGTEGTG
jgi:histidyl-tRNA synthetase